MTAADGGDAHRTLLRIAGLTVRYGATAALDDLALTVRRGELFVLLGASGSGKTTLLRAIAGFVRPDAGTLLLDGAELGALPPHRRPVNTMFQSYALFPHLSVAANVGFGLRQQGRPRTEIAARVAEMLALVSLAGFGARRPHQLSGGQQQRVALARSLAPNPALLLLDEPLSALDRNLRAETRTELLRLQRRLGTTFILVTHDQEEALSLADRIGVMRGGRMAQVGTPAEVYERPNTRFVAEFLGAANVLPVVVRAVTSTEVVLELPGLGTTVRITAIGAGATAAADIAAGIAADTGAAGADSLRAGSSGAGSVGVGVAGASAAGAGSEVTGAGGPGAGGGGVAADATGAGRGAGCGGARPAVGEKMLLAIRPERLTLGAADAANRLDGEVIAHSYAGETLTHTLCLADGTTLRATSTLPRGLAAGVVPAGTRIAVSWHPDAGILLRE